MEEQHRSWTRAPKAADFEKVDTGSIFPPITREELERYINNESALSGAFQMPLRGSSRGLCLPPPDREAPLVPDPSSLPLGPFGTDLQKCRSASAVPCWLLARRTFSRYNNSIHFCPQNLSSCCRLPLFYRPSRLAGLHLQTRLDQTARFLQAIQRKEKEIEDQRRGK